MPTPPETVTAAGDTGSTAARLKRAGEKAGVLAEALPWLQRFHDRIVVVKYGGNAMVDEELKQAFAQDMVFLRLAGIRPVVVHGGGPQIDDMLGRLGKVSEFRDGLRVTDEETLDIARMVLNGQVNREIVSAVNRHDQLAVGLSGEDAGLIVARQRHPDLGYVGDVTNVNPKIMTTLLGAGFIPVISTIGAGADGQAFNINADSAAIAIAASLDAEKLIYLTDVPGVMADVHDPTSLISKMTASRARMLIADGVIVGGMIPKVEACLDAVDRQVPSAHILDGRIPHVTLLELFTDAGVGTMITRSDLGGSS